MDSSTIDILVSKIEREITRNRELRNMYEKPASRIERYYHFALTYHIQQLKLLLDYYKERVQNVD